MPPEDTEDRQIIHKCLNGDTAMFGFLVDKYKEAVYSLAYSRLGNFHDAQDIAQEAFIKAYRKLRTLRHWDKFALWLAAITNNLCKNFIRAKSNRPDREFAEDQLQEIIDHTSVDSYRESLEYEPLKEALSSLPEIYRQVLVLHYLSGYRSVDIAHFLGISIRTVAERLRVGRERLREEMVSTMSVRLREQRLPAGFTFKIMEMVKKVKIHPVIQSRSLPWGLSLATVVMVTIFCLNPYMPWLSQVDTPAASPLPGETKAPKVGEIPVDILENSEISTISSKTEKGKNAATKMQEPLYMVPQAEVNKWIPKGEMPSARYLLAAEVVNGKIYTMGGTASDRHSFVPDVYEYDPITGYWSKKADMPTKLRGLRVSSVNGKIYAFGNYSNGLKRKVIGLVMQYDPVMDIWSKKANQTMPRWYLTASSVNGKIYAIGGSNQGRALSTVEEYDPATDRWSRKTDMPTPRSWLSSSVVDEKIYVIGGSPMDVSGARPVGATAVVEEYDPSTDTWTRKSDMPTARTAHCACAINGIIYVIGGITNDQASLSTMDAYDPAADRWTRKPELLAPRLFYAASIAHGRIYVFGGWDTWRRSPLSNTLSTVEEYTPFPQSKQPETWGELRKR